MRKMKGILAVMSFMCMASHIRGQCFQTISICRQETLSIMGVSCSVLNISEFDQCNTVVNLILSNNNISQIEGKLGANFKDLGHLDLSFNKLQNLPQDFLSQAKNLTELNLASNQLLHLPEDFFSFTTELRTLHLELNPITSVPSSIVNTKLVNLTVDCRCDFIESIMDKFTTDSPNGALTDHSNEMFKCILTNDWFGIGNFYTDHCKRSGLLAVYICVPLVAVGILAGLAAYVIVRKKRKAEDFPSKADSNMSPTHTQPRYTARNMARNMANPSNSSESKMPSQSKAYENVFVSPMQASAEAPVGQYECLDRTKDPRSHAVEEDYYMQSDADQPIYGNTEQMYYNFSATQNPTDDDIYILPDT